MRVLVNEVGFLRSNSYVVFDEKTKDAIVIDAGDDAWLILETIHDNRLKLQAIYATHGHFDHVMAVDDLKQVARVPFYIHRDDLEILSMGK
ncbi:MAG: MBL fold metallo-hydrolase, partial [Candidatus Caldarchaeum sp.]|nr:MBL fold metallo-hydrolase [Candidatus Caldarchaeum sp.]